MTTSSPPSASASEPSRSREFTEDLMALRRTWMLVEALRHLGWLVFGLGSLFALSTTVLLFSGGPPLFSSLLFFGALALSAVVGVQLSRRYLSLGPRCFASFAERRLGRDDNLWITVLEWERFPEACSGAPQLFEALGARARTSLETARAFALLSPRELRAPWLGAAAVFLGIFVAWLGFAPIFPSVVHEDRAARVQYFRFRAIPPAHTGRGRVELVSSSCDARLPMGSELLFEVVFRHTPTQVVLSDGQGQLGLIPSPDTDRALSASFRLESSRNLLLYAEGMPPQRCSLQAIPDSPPLVSIADAAEQLAPFEEGRPVKVHADDDYGLREVRLGYRINGVAASRPLWDASASERHRFSMELLLDERTLPLQAGDQVEYWAEAFDNAPGVTGAPGGQTSLSKTGQWLARSERQATLDALIAEESELLWFWVRALGAALEGPSVTPAARGAGPDWARDLDTLQALVRRWEGVFSPLGRNERRVSALVDKGLRKTPHPGGEGRRFIEELVWLWSSVLRDHVLGLVDWHREAIDAARQRASALLSRPATARNEADSPGFKHALDLELARVQHHLLRIEEIAFEHEVLLPEASARSRLRSRERPVADEEVRDWIARLELAREFAGREDWDGLERSLAGLLSSSPENPFSGGDESQDRLWMERVRALHERVRPVLEHQRTVVDGIELLVQEEEQALARWAAENLPGFDEEVDLIVERLVAAAEGIPLSNQIENQIDTIKRNQALLDSMRQDWVERRYHRLQSDLEELKASFGLLQSDFYLNDLDGRPLRRVFRLLDRLALLLDRVERYKSTILGETGRRQLEEWEEEQAAVVRSVSGLQRGFREVSEGHPEVASLVDLASRATKQAKKARRGLSEHRAEQAINAGRDVNSLLEKLESACQAASGSMSLGQRMLVRVGGDVALSSRSSQGRRLQDLLDPYLKALVPTRYRHQAERYYQYLLEL